MATDRSFFSFHVRRGRIAKIILPPSDSETVVILDPQQIQQNHILIEAPENASVQCEGKNRAAVTAGRTATTLADDGLAASPGDGGAK